MTTTPTETAWFSQEFARIVANVEQAIIGKHPAVTPHPPSPAVPAMRCATIPTPPASSISGQETR